jgi:hypothetical protein
LVQQERHAVVLLLGLSLLTIIFVIGIGIGIMAIRGWPASPARAALN